MKVNVEASTESVLAIAVTKHEELLEQQRVHLENTIRKLNKTKEEQTTRLETAAKAQAKSVYGAQLEHLAKVLVEFGFEKVTDLIEDVVLDVTKREIKATCKLSANDATTRNYYGVSRDTLATYKSIPASDEICKMIDELNATIDELDNLTNLHTEVRRALANIGRVERRARAALARKVLEATEEGQALLKTMEDVTSPFYGLLQLQAATPAQG